MKIWQTKEWKRDYDKKYREKNKKIIKEKLKIIYDNDKERRKKKANDHYYKNKNIILKKQYTYKKKKLERDPAFKLKERLGSRFYKLLTKKGLKKSQSTINLVGCDIQ
jgi:hypothetical protein